MTTTRKTILGIAAALVAVILFAPGLIGSWAGQLAGAYEVHKREALADAYREKNGMNR